MCSFIVISLAAAPAGEVPMVSPRLGNCVFVLAVLLPNQFPSTLGTAWAVSSPSKRLLLSALHCLRTSVAYDVLKEHLYVVESIAFNDDGTVRFGRHVKVEVLDGDEVSDIVALRAAETLEHTIDLCPVDEIAAGEDLKVKSYHCPCQTFPHDIPVLSATHTDYGKVKFFSDHHLFVSGEHMHGSSGGVVVDLSGRAIALVCSGYVPGVKLPIPDSFQTIWERVSALSEGRGIYTRCIMFSVVRGLYTFVANN